MNFEILSEEREKQNIHYFCIAAGNHRYDLSVIYSSHFLGKAMVISIQSERMALLCSEDIEHSSYWAPKLGIVPEDIPKIEEFLHFLLDQKLVMDQY
ncbi:SAV0927 family protein [Ectobacillus panaciterrae]|uniref:SAV0927 family protein n=1 Tax=Ectobacillus panaciterrae TaxID=363872 RepID=UPI000406EBA0|nr:SAV0927 family protein [Ectobacillus panaciterrae]